MDFLVVEVDRGVNKGDFGLMFWQLLDEFVVELMEIVEHDAFVLVTRVEDSGGMVVIFVELIVFWGLREAENIDIFIFVDGVI